jgi:lysylphosphatidylglycerol synthetase-like protein (DUF2156 family)
MPDRPRSVTACLTFILFNALVWLIFGGIIAANAHPSLAMPPLLKGVMAFLSFCIAGFLAGLFFLLVKRNRIAYLLALGLLSVISVLSLFDQFGLSDLVILAINIVPIVLLIKDRDWYLQGKALSVGMNE